MKEKKERLDVLLVDNGFFDSREKAKRAIMAGLVFVNGEKEDKAGSSFPLTADIVVKGNPLPYGRPEAGKSLEDFSHRLKGAHLYGYRCVYRRFHGLYAAKRGKRGVQRGCGARTVRLEVTKRCTGSRYGEV